MDGKGGVHRRSIKGEAVFMLPMLICFIPVVIIPFFYAIYMGFMRWNGISSERIFIGLQNYISIFTADPAFWESIWFSFRQTVAITLVSNILGLAFALVISSLPRKFQGLPRTLLLLPNIMGGVTISVMLAMAIVFGDFVIINTLAGGHFMTAQMYLYDVMKKSGQRTCAVIVILFLVTLIISACAFFLQSRGKDRKDR